MTDRIIKNMACEIAADTLGAMEEQFEEYVTQFLLALKANDDTSEGRHRVSMGALRLWQLTTSMRAYFKDLTQFSVNGSSDEQRAALNAEARRVHERLGDVIENAGRTHFGDKDFELAREVLNAMPVVKEPSKKGDPSLN